MAEVEGQASDTPPGEQDNNGNAKDWEDRSTASEHNENRLDKLAYQDDSVVYVDEKPLVASLSRSGGCAGIGGMGDQGSPDRCLISSSSRRKEGTHSKKKKKKGMGARGYEGNPALSVEDLFVTISTVQVGARMS